jgi:DNA gyrase subunit A
MIDHYIKHQKEVISRRTKFELDKAEARAHILEGLKIAIDNLDEVIRIISASKNENEAKQSLIARFDFSEKQAQAIVDIDKPEVKNFNPIQETRILEIKETR